MNEFIQFAVAGGALYALYQVWLNARRMYKRRQVVSQTEETSLPASHQKALLKVLVDADLDEEEAVGTLLVLASRILESVDGHEVAIVSETHEIKFEIARYADDDADD